VTGSRFHQLSSPAQQPLQPVFSSFSLISIPHALPPATMNNNVPVMATMRRSFYRIR
jgi:hypothetical protein